MRQFFQGMQLPDWFGEWVLGNKVLVLSLVALLTAAGGIVALQMPVQTALVEAFVDDPSLLDRYRSQCQRLGGDSDDLIYAATREGPQLFTAPKMNAIRAAARDLEQLPEITQVSCLPDVPYKRKPRRLSMRQVAARAVARRRLAEGDIESLTGEFKLRPIWPEDESLQQRIPPAALRQALLENPWASGNLLGQDGTTQIMVIKVAPEAAVQVQDQVRLTKQIETTFQSHGLGRDGVHLVGLIVSQGWMFSEVAKAFYLLFPIGLAIICTTVWALFRRLTVVLLTAVVGLIAIVWAIGATGLIFGKLSVMVAAAPLVILVISTSDVIHLATAYKLELGKGQPKDEALRTVVKDVGGACVLTSITTFVGFISLVTVPAPSLRHFAVAAAVGVASALLIAITVVPIALSMMRPLPSDEQRKGMLTCLLDMCVDGCQFISLRYSRTVMAACMVLFGVAIYCTFQIHVDADFPKRFPPDHPFRTAVEFFNEELAGTTIVDVFLEADSELLVNRTTLQRLQELEEKVRTLPSVTEVYSLNILFEAANEIFYFGTEDELPENDIACQSCVKLFREIDAEQVGFLISPESSLTRFSVRLRPSGYLAVRNVADEINTLALETLPEGVVVETSGSHPIVGQIVREIVKSQLHGIVVCFVSITLIMAWGVGSLRVAFWSQFPNMLPAVLVIGCLAITLETVDTDMLGIPTVALGIAVDDTVHFLHRFRLQFQKSKNTRLALEQTFPYTGQAILKTTIILCVGLMPFALSSFLTVWMLGTFLVFTLISAVLADLILLPAMIRLGFVRWDT